MGQTLRGNGGDSLGRKNLRACYSRMLNPNAVNLEVRGGDLLSAAIALLKCCSGRIGMAPAACSRGLAESGMRLQVPPPSTLDRGHEEKLLFNESKRCSIPAPSLLWVGAGSAIARKTLTRPAQLGSP